MKIIIIGAGDVGHFMASTLCTEANNVVVVDINEVLLGDLQEHLDIMTVAGNGAQISVLEQAGVASADLLLAVSSSTESNILACQIVKKFEVAKTICRVSSHGFFDSENMPAAEFGIDQVIYPIDACAKKVFEVLRNPEYKEFVTFSSEKAALISFSVKLDSPLVGVRLADFPEPELLQKLRICAIFRRGRVIVPRGDAKIFAYDEVYIAGERSALDDLISYATPNPLKVSNVIVSGANPLSIKLIELLNDTRIKACLIEPDQAKAEKAVTEISINNSVIVGDASDTRILEEAGIDECDAFITNVDNQNSIINCLLAKRRGAERVYAITDKPESLEIITGIPAIDTAFSTRIAAVNQLLHNIRGGNLKVGALLNRISAEVLEFVITSKSKIVGKRIDQIACPKQTILAMIIRNDEIVPAVGELVLEDGDHVIALTGKNAVPLVEKMFSKTKLF